MNTFFAQNQTSSKNLWVFCCGMFRSGSTLQYQLASALVEKLNIGTRSKYLPEGEFGVLLNEYKDTRGLLVLKAHFITPLMQTLLDDKKALSIGTFRDIRDIAVSMMKMWDLSFDEVLEQKKLELAIEGLNKWIKYPGNLVSKYEEMILDPTNELKRIAFHLGIHCEDTSIREIADEYSLKKQKERVEKVAKTKALAGIKGAYWDPDTLLHYNHINGGTIGAWKAELSKEQIIKLETKFGDWLVGRGYSLSSSVTQLEQ